MLFATMMVFLSGLGVVALVPVQTGGGGGDYDEMHFHDETR
jgi:hypothetical protein